MKTWWQNSKKCLAADLLVAAPLLALSSMALAATPPTSDVLKNEIVGRKSSDFKTLLSLWEKSYGPKAVDPLLAVAADRKLSDPDRYIALMGAAKLGGSATASQLVPYLKDGSWMIRSGALRALMVLNRPETSSHVLPLLKDPALVVRRQAVDAVEKLRPEGTVEALMGALESSNNYHHGKAQWVPNRALQVLSKLGSKEIAPRLQPLLKHDQDPSLLKEAIATLESLTGRKLASGKPLKAQVQAWKAALQSKL